MGIRLGWVDIEFPVPSLSSVWLFEIRAKPAMLSNLIHRRRRVQRLLVRVIFLLGISDTSRPIRRIEFSLSQTLSRMRNLHFADSSGQPRLHLSGWDNCGNRDLCVAYNAWHG